MSAPAPADLCRREPGIDLLRCLGLFCVVNVHAFLYNGFYSELQDSPAVWAAGAFRWLFFCCNGLFLLLTGYLKSNKPLCPAYYRSLLGVILGYVLTCVISFPIRHFCLGEVLTPGQWLEKALTFANYGWYVEMYIGLFLISPILNLAMAKLTTPGQWAWLVGIMLLLSALPSITVLPILPDHWTSLYPITYYVLGAAIRRWQPRVPTWLALAGAFATAMGLSLATLLTATDTVSSGFGQGYGGFWITAIAVFLFLALYRLRPGPRLCRLLAWMSAGCFEGYILSRLLDVWVYDQFPQWHHPAGYPLLFLVATVPIFLFAVVSGHLTHTVAQKLSDRLWHRLSQLRRTFAKPV